MFRTNLKREIIGIVNVMLTFHSSLFWDIGGFSRKITVHCFGLSKFMTNICLCNLKSLFHIISNIQVVKKMKTLKSNISAFI